MNRIRSRSLLIEVACVLLVGGFCWAQSSQPAEAPAAAEAPKESVKESKEKEKKESKEWDPWTSKTLLGDIGGWKKELEEAGLKVELTFQNILQHNFSGGLSTDHWEPITGTYDFSMELDFGKLKLIPGGSFYIKAKGGYNESINSKEVGGLFNVNADAFEDYAIFVRKWWYKQMLFDDKIELRVGRIQTNKDLFDTGLYAYHEDKDFLSRASIRNPQIPHDTAIGVFAKVKPLDWLYFQAATYDAQVAHRTRTGFDTAFHDEAWWNAIWELGATPKWETDKGKMPGHYRLGWWYRPNERKVFKNTLDGRLRDEYRGDDVGFYLGADQMVWKENDNVKDDQGLGLFSRFGWAHRDINRIDYYWQVGCSYKGLIPTRDKDVTAFSVAQGIVSEQYRHNVNHSADRETVYEWYYQIQLTPWCTISPDLQVITNPGGGKDAHDAFVGGVRLRIIFF